MVGLGSYALSVQPAQAAQLEFDFDGGYQDPSDRGQTPRVDGFVESRGVGHIWASEVTAKNRTRTVKSISEDYDYDWIGYPG